MVLVLPRNWHPRACQHTEAVEVAHQRPIGVAIRVGSGDVLRELEQRGVHPDQQRGLALAGRHQAEVASGPLRGRVRFEHFLEKAFANPAVLDRLDCDGKLAAEDGLAELCLKWYKCHGGSGCVTARQSMRS